MAIALERPVTRPQMSNGRKIGWGALAAGAVAVIAILAWLGVPGPKDLELKVDHKADVETLKAAHDKDIARIEADHSAALDAILERLPPPPRHRHNPNP